MAREPMRATPVSRSEAEHILRQAWEARFGESVQDRQLRLILALWDLETAGGQRQWNHNWGNLVQRDLSQPYYEADDSGNLRQFKAYLTPDEGADDLLRELELKPEWFGPVLQGASPEVFAAGLQARGYFEAPLSRYAPALRRRWENFPHLNAPMHGRPKGTSKKQSDSALPFFFSPARLSVSIFGVGGNDGDHLRQ